jgi:hypothetical protein
VWGIELRAPVVLEFLCPDIDGLEALGPLKSSHFG